MKSITLIIVLSACAAVTAVYTSSSGPLEGRWRLLSASDGPTGEPDAHSIVWEFRRDGRYLVYYDGERRDVGYEYGYAAQDGLRITLWSQVDEYRYEVRGNILTLTRYAVTCCGGRNHVEKNDTYVFERAE